ncbi:MAG: type II toxin-antitoxin system HicB family antitoxin [Treponema sp.]|nr:type II toxin-antitoxin system HicB family antitoxin [Treponema sp.]
MATGGYGMNELLYTYWEGEDGWLVGYLHKYPEQWTQGKDIKELEEMLLDLYENILEEEKRIKTRIEKTGVLRISA